jgi:type IV secretory pathway VirB2 component (pilin)
MINLSLKKLSTLFFVSICSVFLLMASNNNANATYDKGASGAGTSADDNAFVQTLCNILDIVTGAGGKAFAAFAIISIGIGFFTGKVSWGLMIGVAAGIAAMFGAPTIVSAISGETDFSC